MDDDENISTLLAMGFPDIGEIKRALRMAKNDLNEAVTILTNDSGGGGGDTFGPSLFDDSSGGGKAGSGGGQASQGDVEMPEQETLSEKGFPLNNLYELEQRVFQDNWSIPYRREESLGKCLAAATVLAKQGQLEEDPSCQKFLERIAPEAFRKLLTSNATQRWALDIQEGIYEMVDLFIDLIVARLDTEPVPVGLLNILAMVS